MHSRHTFRLRSLALLVAALCVAIAGCGQTGPLYLPDERGEVIIREAAPQQAPQTTPEATSATATPTP